MIGYKPLSRRETDATGPRELADRFRGFEQVLRSDRAEAADVFRLDQFQLPVEKAAAVLRFFGERVAIPGGRHFRIFRM